MSAVNRESILEEVRQLPPEEQRALAQEILRLSAGGQAAPAPVRREPPTAPDPHLATSSDLRGAAKTETSIDDERLLDESRMERYGG